VSGKPRPSPCYLDRFAVWKIIAGRKVWRNTEGTRLYSWDPLHGEIEVFDDRGFHLGAIHAVTGRLIKEADHGKRLYVK
jgi:hypothetical protein